MLQLSGALIGKPVLSLRTGAPVAMVLGPIINPNNLKIEGWYCEDSIDRKQFILLDQDIRDIIAQGFVINDHDVLAEPHELVRLKHLIELNFGLIGKQVVTSGKDKVGKVADYATEVSSMYIQKLYVSQSVFRSLAGGNLGIDRTQIVEITNTKIVINDLHGKVPARVGAVA